MADRWWFSRRALAVTLVSLVVWTGWNFTRDQCHPAADLSCGVFTDHYSHMNLARMFTRVGTDIYRVPRSTLGDPLTDEQRAALPSDLHQFGPDVVYSVPGWPPDKPYTVTWPQLASFYPPGDLVLFAPASLLYSYTDISFSTINLLLIQLLLIYSHITIYLLFAFAFRPSAVQWLSVIGVLFAYNEIVHWTLEGFYDGAWIAPLLLTPFLLARNRGLSALLTFSLALVMHFRALFLLPWAFYALYAIIRDRQWREWKIKDHFAVTITVICAGAAAGVFLLALPSLRELPITNQLNSAAQPTNSYALAILGLIVGAGAVVFAYGRAWRDLGVLAWIGFMCVMIPEVRPWDSLAIVPWLVAPVAASPGNWTPLVKQTRTAVVILISILVFTARLTPDWIELALRRVFG